MMSECAVSVVYDGRTDPEKYGQFLCVGWSVYVQEKTVFLAQRRCEAVRGWYFRRATCLGTDGRICESCTRGPVLRGWLWSCESETANGGCGIANAVNVMVSRGVSGVQSMTTTVQLPFEDVDAVVCIVASLVDGVAEIDDRCLCCRRGRLSRSCRCHDGRCKCDLYECA